MCLRKPNGSSLSQRCPKTRRFLRRRCPGFHTLGDLANDKAVQRLPQPLPDDGLLFIYSGIVRQRDREDKDEPRENRRRVKMGRHAVGDESLPRKKTRDGTSTSNTAPAATFAPSANGRRTSPTPPLAPLLNPNPQRTRKNATRQNRPTQARHVRVSIRHPVRRHLNDSDDGTQRDAHEQPTRPTRWPNEKGHPKWMRITRDTILKPTPG
jgi:hypothetical protein